MTAWSDVRTFQMGVGTTGALTTVTGLPGQPVALRLLAVGLTAAGVGVHCIHMWGAATGTGEQWACAYAYEDGSNSTAKGGRDGRNDCCLVEIDIATPAEGGELSLSAFTSDGYTLTRPVGFVNDLTVIVMAIGGDGMEAQAGSVISNANPTQAFSGILDFQPDFLEIASILQTTADVGFTSGNTQWSHGFGRSSTDRHVVAGQTHTADNTGNIRSAYSAILIALLVDAGTDIFNTWWDLVSLDATGFTLSRSSGTGARAFYYLAFKGGTGELFRIFTTPAFNDTSNHDISTAGVNPAGLFCMARPNVTATQTAPTSSSEVAMGMASGPSARAAVWVGALDNQSQHQGNQALATDRLFINRALTGSAALEGDLDLNAFGTEKFTLDQVSADATVPLIVGWVVGNAPSETRHHVVRGMSQAVHRAASW